MEFNKKNITEFKEFFEALDDKLYDIFSYVNKNYQALLSFKYSTYTKFDFNDNSDSILLIYENADDLSETTYIDLPLEHLYNNTWKDYFKNKFEKLSKKLAVNKSNEDDYFTSLIHGYEGC